jgi:hypothetical protein
MTVGENGRFRGSVYTKQQSTPFTLTLASLLKGSTGERRREKRDH